MCIVKASTIENRQIIRGQLLEVPEFGSIRCYVITHYVGLAGGLGFKEHRQEVERDSIAKFTELFDFHGNEIYEYDRIDIKWKPNGNYKSYWVEFHRGTPYVCGWEWDSNASFNRNFPLALLYDRGVCEDIKIINMPTEEASVWLN